MHAGRTTHGAELGIKKIKEKHDRVRQLREESEKNKKYLKDREVDYVIDNRYQIHR